MSNPVPPTPSRSLTIFMGTLVAFASFAVLAALLQAGFGGKGKDASEGERLQKKADIAKEQDDLLTKYGLKTDAAGVISKSLEQIKTRKVAATTQIVPGSPTALKAAAPVPAAAPAAAPTPAPSAPPTPVAPASSPAPQS